MNVVNHKERCFTPWNSLHCLTGVDDSTKFLDSKNRGINGGQKGEITWDLDDISHNFCEGKLCF